MTPSVLERVCKVITAAAGISPDEVLTEETLLVGGGLLLDSVAAVELLVGLEKEFGIAIVPDELLSEKAFRSVGALVAFLEARLTAGT